MLRLKWLIIGALCAFMAAGGLWAWAKVLRPNAIGRFLSEALEDKLRARPAITLRKYVVVEEKKPIAELALVSRVTNVERRIESVLFHSKAELSLRAVFTVKAGFDLRAARLNAILDPGLKKARLDLPPPKVLSIEMTHYEVLADRNGWWNRIPESEKELAMRDMLADAKLESIRAGILEDCRQAMEKDMAEVSHRTGVTVVYRYRMPADTGAAVTEEAR
jgi:hypothetical protein